MYLQLSLLAVSYLSVTALAAGFQGCLERIWAFQAYELDELNAPEDRYIGFKCNFWGDREKRCMGKWIPCSGTAHAGRCNFDEFIVSLGRAPKPTGWAVYHPGTERIDIDETARLCHSRYTGKRPNVPNFPAQHVLYGHRGSFNKYTERMSRIVDETYRKHGRANNRDRFDNLDATMDRIMVIREGDHGGFVIEEAEKKLGPYMKVEVEDLGPDPLDPNKRLKAFDFRATALRARADGVDHYVQKLRTFATEFYSGETARKHLVLNRIYRKAKDRAVSCRG